MQNNGTDTTEGPSAPSEIPENTVTPAATADTTGLVDTTATPAATGVTGGGTSGLADTQDDGYTDVYGAAFPPAKRRGRPPGSKNKVY